MPADEKISIVVPVHNESGAIGPFLDAIEAVIPSLGCAVEIVFVDDGSTDATCDEIRDAIGAHDALIRLVALSRNFGKEAALTAGIDVASGDAVVPMDVDLQDPPNLIADFVKHWRAGYMVVYARRTARPDDTFVKGVTAKLFYRLFNSLSHTDIPSNAGDFRLIDRSVVEALSAYRENNRFMKGLFSTVGFRSTGVDYIRPARQHGQTKWNYWRLWNFALDGMFGFSTVPLRVWTYVGFGISLMSFCYAVFIVVRTLIFGTDTPGYASLIAAVLFMGGIQLISLGILGEYIGRMFIEAKRRPIYIVDKARSVLDEGEGR